MLLELTVSELAIGPGRLYNIGKIYSGLLHMFWIGALLPIITFFLQKKFPNSKILNAIHWPIFFAGTGNLPPAVRRHSSQLQFWILLTVLYRLV